MTDDDHNKPPTTTREIGIHLGYLREDIKDLKETVENIAKGTPSRKEVDELDERITKLEVLVDGIKTRIAGWAIGIFVAMVLTLYGLDKWFKG